MGVVSVGLDINPDAFHKNLDLLKRAYDGEKKEGSERRVSNRSNGSLMHFFLEMGTLVE